MGEEDKSLLKLMNLIRKINTARSMPPKLLAETLVRLAKRRIRKYAIIFHPVKFSDEYFLKATGCKTMNEFLNREVPLFFFNPDDEYGVVETIKKEYPESISETLNDADKICNHIFDLRDFRKNI